jgi:hypothetical protein
VGWTPQAVASNPGLARRSGLELVRGPMRERLRREHPSADDGAIEQLLTTWLHTRPGAEHGDYDDGA